MAGSLGEEQLRSWERDGFVIGFHFHDSYNRPETLLGHDAHGVIDVH